MSETTIWRGQSTRLYTYHRIDDPTWGGIKPVSGNYMFCRIEGNRWRPMYIGIADDLRDRISNHEIWPNAKRLGATFVFAHANLSRSDREFEEKDLIVALRPSLNTQHNPSARR